MDLLELKLNPYKNINTISLNGKPLSPYSELSNFVKEPFLKWADKLFDSAEREINDNFKLHVIGECFEQMFLGDLQKSYAACVSYETGQFQVNTSVRERYDMVKTLTDKYGTSYTEEDFKIPTVIDTHIPLDNSFICSAHEGSAFLYVTDNKNFLQKAANQNGAFIAVLISGRSGVTCLGDMKYLWEITPDRLSEVIGCIVDRFAKIPAITKMAADLNRNASVLTEDKNKLLMITEIDAILSVSEIPSLEVGTEYTISVKVFPENSSMPHFRVVSSNEGVIVANGLKLQAVALGFANIDIYRDTELIPFVRKKVHTFRDNYVNRIELNIPEKRMAIGGSQTAKLSVFPDDADDARKISWNIDNPKIIAIDNSGCITALTAGKAWITASSKNASAKVQVEVLPNISQIQVSSANVNLYVGQTQRVTVDVSPANCYDTSYIWKSSDQNVAIVEMGSNGADVIRAIGIGDCVLTCKARRGGCTTECQVKVESTFKKRENMHTYLSYTFLCALISVFCAVLTFSVGAFIAAVGTILCGLVAMGKNKADRIWSIVLIVIAVLAFISSI